MTDQASFEQFLSTLAPHAPVRFMTQDFEAKQYDSENEESESKSSG